MNRLRLLATLLAFFVAQGVRSAPPHVLLLHGNRPWTAADTAGILKRSGVKVTLVDSTGLAGLGGASLKQFPTDPVEPKAADGITPALARLEDFSAVIVAAMSSADQAAMFTPERIARLKTYLAAGGGLLVTENVPSSLQEILPVTFDAGTRPGKAERCRPRHSMFSGLPETWPCFGNHRTVRAKPGSVVLVSAEEAQGKSSTPYLCAGAIGRGTVVYWNADWGRRGGGFKQLADWAYFGTILVRLAGHVSRAPLDAEAAMYRRLPVPEAPPLEREELTVQPPVFEETEDRFAEADVDASASGVVARLANGVRIEWDEKQGEVHSRITAGGEEMIGLQPPDFLAAGTAQPPRWNSSVAEAVPEGKASSGKWLGLRYRLAGWARVASGGVALSMAGKEPAASGIKLRWIFRPKQLRIADRTYLGFGERIEAAGFPMPIESVRLRAGVRLGRCLAGHRAWRIACYGKPRGFAEIEFEPDRSATSSAWDHFGTGQPFNWLIAPAGAFCQYLDAAGVNQATIDSRVGDEQVYLENRLRLAQVGVEASTPDLWHLFSPGQPSDTNAWMGLYQYLRLRYCQRAGIAPALPMPTATHSNMCSRDEVQRTISAAARLGFQRYVLPLCPSMLEAIQSERVAELYGQIRAAGMRPMPWSPGGYTQGGDAIIGQHPEWMVYDRTGQLYKYFRLHPVFDLGNERYREHYFSVIDRAREAGLGDLYMDMGGAQAGVVNYADRKQRPGLSGAIEVYRGLRKRDVAVGIEGQSPLVLDNFWYRQGLYANHAGKEFAFVGMACWTNAPDHLSLDYFRLGMHNAFFVSPIAGAVCGMEIIPDEMRLTEQIGRFNAMFNAAREVVGRPFVRQTRFGTSWTSNQGAALFVWRPVRQLALGLPGGWRVKAVLTQQGARPTSSENSLRDLPHCSLVLIEKGP